MDFSICSSVRPLAQYVDLRSLATSSTFNSSGLSVILYPISPPQQQLRTFSRIVWHGRGRCVSRTLVSLWVGKTGTCEGSRRGLAA